ncbi:phospholipid carrier-dependent glycosyltransferase [Pectinatus frisingensis]|uniref:phospholipid carrier-dependent glycosyltransferase n=1 Tax=Pectinatus frisingensis TaxID=865 RepID=UPI0018C4DA2A|nr:phospholipid carrier-dependent glycosyltransferase [Pectinatus frisingensis]
MHTLSTRQKKLAAAAVIISIIALYLVHIYDYPLMDPDEGRYSEIPREMIATGDFITPRLNGVEYFEKPILQYWLTAASMTVFGENEGAVRVVPAVTAVVNVFLTAWLAKLMFTNRTALLTAAILATTTLHIAVGSINILDMMITMFMTLSLVTFYQGRRTKNRRWYLLMYAAMALGLLTKGLISIVLPLGIIFWYMLFTRQWSIIRDIIYLPGIILFFIIGVPWFYLVCQANGDFFYFFFIREHFLRFATKIEDRYQPVWFFIPMVILGMFPWLGFLPALFTKQGVIRSTESDDNKRDIIFLLTWFFVVFIFYSCSDSKLVPYILPCLSPLAILLAASIRRSVKLDRWMAHGLLVNSVGCFIFVAALIWYSTHADYLNAWEIFHKGWLIFLSLTVGLAVVICIWLKTKQIRCTISAFVVVAFLFAAGLQSIHGQVAVERTADYVATDIRRIEQPGDIVVSYGDYIQGLPFYLQKRVVVASYLGELEFGSKHPSGQGWFINDAQLMNLWNSDKRVFVVFDKSKKRAINKLFPDKIKSSSPKGGYYFIVNRD